MIDSLEINGYRCFDRFTMSGLGRVNLLVGTNNSGKTSVLEALYLLTSEGDPYALGRILADRGEQFDREQSSGPASRPEYEVEYEVCHLFRGHEIEEGSKFTISASFKNDIQMKYDFKLKLLKLLSNERINFEGLHGDPLGLIVSIDGPPEDGRLDPNVLMISLTQRGGIYLDTDKWFSRRVFQRGNPKRSYSVQYISTRSLSSKELSLMWNGIVLTDEEESVLLALRIIEPKIKRVAVATALNKWRDPVSRGGFKVRLTDVETPVPIGSLGDGMWRMLAIAIALTQAKDGYLLIDEIDTGLHHTVMADMWKMIAQTAKELNVQVFATTHSYDCVTSLAAICRDDVENDNQVTIQRIKPGREKSVSFNEAEIIIAAEHHAEQHIEVR
ncbi:MAG: ATP-binding protein [Alphaproteobacteria bacterium]|nr:ATP-binding protein [Alphaproteobacteria bacterium]